MHQATSPSNLHETMKNIAHSSGHWEFFFFKPQFFSTFTEWNELQPLSILCYNHYSWGSGCELVFPSPTQWVIYMFYICHSATEESGRVGLDTKEICNLREWVSFFYICLKLSHMYHFYATVDFQYTCLKLQISGPNNTQCLVGKLWIHNQ